MGDEGGMLGGQGFSDLFFSSDDGGQATQQEGSWPTVEEEESVDTYGSDSFETEDEAKEHALGPVHSSSVAGQGTAHRKSPQRRSSSKSRSSSPHRITIKEETIRKTSRSKHKPASATLTPKATHASSTSRHKSNKQLGKAPVATLASLLRKGDTIRRKIHQEGAKLSPDQKQAMWDRALQTYQSALAMDPSSWEAHYGCGIAFKRCGEYEEAAECFESALDIEPEGRKGTIWHLCGASYLALGRTKDAIDRFERAVEIDSTNEKFKRDLQAAAPASDTRAEDAEAAHPHTVDQPASSSTRPADPMVARNKASTSAQLAASAKEEYLSKLKQELRVIDDQLKENLKRTRRSSHQSRWDEMVMEFQNAISAKVDYQSAKDTMRFAKPWLDRPPPDPKSSSAKFTSTLKKTTDLVISNDVADPTSDNGATETAEHILPALADAAGVFRNLESLDLSGNRMTRSSANSLAEFLRKRECHILTLKAEHTNMSDSMAANILECISVNSTIRAIHLRHNCLKHQAGEVIGRGLATTSCLRELLLGWNNIYGEGLVALSLGLSKCKTLKRLDLSWNLIGRESQRKRSEVGRPSTSPQIHAEDAIQSFSEALAVNRSLNFLNLNSCSLSPNHSAILGSGLLQNHTIYGLIFRGNKGTTDAKGFIRDDLPVSGDYRSGDTDGEATVAGQCWEKDLWSEHKFHFTCGVSGEVDEESPMYLHLLVDDWKPDEMKSSDRATTPWVTDKTASRRTMYSSGVDDMSVLSNGTAVAGSGPSRFTLYRMLPPGRIWYFFSQDGRILCGRDQPQERHPRLGVLRNYVDIKPREGKLVPAALRVVPRGRSWAPIDEDSLLAMEASRPEWDLHRSVYAGRAISSDFFDKDMARKALGCDINLTKIVAMKIVQSEAELEDLEEVLEPIFCRLVALFRWYASAEDVGDPFTISWDECRDFAKAAGVIDNMFTEGMMREEFIVVNVELEAEAGNDGDSLVRFEFIELIVRLANKKYVDHQLAKTLSKAVQRLYRRILVPYMLSNGVDVADDFREKLLYTEPVAMAFEHDKDRLTRLFVDHTSGEMGGQSFMRLEDFTDMAKDANLLDEGFPRSEARRVFLNSIIIVENEQTTEKYKELSFVDFMEAVARIALAKLGGKANPATLGAKVTSVIDQMLFELYTEQVHGNLLLKRQGKKKSRDRAKAKMLEIEHQQRQAERKARLPPPLPGLGKLHGTSAGGTRSH